MSEKNITILDLFTIVLCIFDFYLRNHLFWKDITKYFFF